MNGSYNTVFDEKKTEMFFKQSMDWLTARSGRAIHQTKFLYNMLGDFRLLLELEEACKVFSIFYCPNSIAECMALILKLRVWKVCGWLQDDIKYKLI